MIQMCYRRLNAYVTTINSCQNCDNIDLVDFANNLKYIVNNHNKNNLCIVSLARCSNITSIIQDDISIGNIIGKYQRIQSNVKIIQCKCWSINVGIVVHVHLI